MIRNIEDLCCTRCGGKLKDGDKSSAQLIENRFTCGSCGHKYASLWGIPYLADFESEDILGLIEIAANIENTAQNESHTKAALDQWRELIKECHAAPDRERFMKDAPAWASPWLMSRYSQWYQYNLLTQQLDLRGKTALDIGAGLGFDTNDVLADGARVTALEFSPLLARGGQKALPEVRWIGGVSHALPFEDNSFDYIFCNAALHHMRDVPSALSEMIRVVRCGGSIITTGDSYCADRMPENLELTIFNMDPAVLAGVNEGIIRFDSLAQTLDTYIDYIEVQVAVDARGTPYESMADSFGFLILDYKKDRDKIAASFQSISMKIRLLNDYPVPRRFQATAGVVFSAFNYSQLLCDLNLAMASLISVIPSRYIDMPFPGKTASKFSLLNGWQNPFPGIVWRQGYKRARLYYSIHKLANPLRTYVRAVVEKGDCPQLEVNINGKSVVSQTLRFGRWTQIDIPLDPAASGERCAIEFHMKRIENAFEDGLFRVSFLRGWRRLLSDLLYPFSLQLAGLRFRLGQLPRIRYRLRIVKKLWIKLEEKLSIKEEIKKMKMKMALSVKSVHRVMIWILPKIIQFCMEKFQFLEMSDMEDAGLLDKEKFRMAILRRAVRVYPDAVELILAQELKSKLCYSHEGEDILLQRFFDSEHIGFYVDVGANDPQEFSNTCLLYQRGWHGVNIDATPGSMERFKRLRPKDINLEYAVSDSYTELAFHSFKVSALNTFSEELAENYISSGWQRKGKFLIQPRTLASILDEVIPENQTIDLLNVDVEGGEFNVLVSNNWDRYRPKLILLEMLNLPLKEIANSQITRFLEKKGYVFMAKLSTTAVFEFKEKFPCAE